jgi:hypothetical protein
MDEKQKPQKFPDAPVISVVDGGEPAEASDRERKGEWQGYDLTLLTALLDD